MKDKRDVLTALGWSEELLDAILSPSEAAPLPPIGDFEPLVVSSTEISTESLELTLSGGEGIIFDI